MTAAPETPQHPVTWLGWGEFAARAPELAAFGAQRLDGTVAYLGTVTGDRLPRVHPVQAIVSPHRLMLFMFPTSPKAHDLQRDGRYALHTSVPDTDGTGGEFLVRGRARQTDDVQIRAEATRFGFEPRPVYILFELSVEDALANEYVDGEPNYRRWRPTG